MEELKVDLGCGFKKHGPEYIGIDKKAFKGVDFICNLEKLPWPIKDNSFSEVLSSHIFEHLDPALIFEIFDECWRVLKEGKEMIVITPYGGGDQWLMDPTHKSHFTETSFLYLDPQYPSYDVYRPKPWSLEEVYFSSNGIITARLKKIKEKIEFVGEKNVS
jgi:ubiquinone/menaquinone biosynthesis C-methylase UbiE